MALKSLKWKAPIKAQVLESPADLKTAFPNAKVISISGIAIDDSVNANEWSLSEKELPSVAEQLKGKQLTINHSTNMEDVIGRITETKINGKEAIFTAEIISENPDILIPILTGNVNSVSIEADAESACSICGKEYIGSLKPCRCSDDHQVIKNVKVERLSIVANPAYENTKFVPISFAAAIDEKIKEEKFMSDEKKTEKEVETPVKAEEPKLPSQKDLEDLQERLKKAEEAIAEIRKKAEAEEDEEEEEEEEEEEKSTEKKKSSVKKATIDKTKSVTKGDTTQNMIPPQEIQKMIAEKSPSNSWWAEIIAHRNKMDARGV